MHKYLKPLVITLALATGTSCFTSSAQAAADEIEALRARMNSGDQAGAWQQAQQMAGKWESDPDFDFLYGLLAIDNQRYNEAQFALERVTVAEPGNLRARLALAMAYYKLGDMHSARRQFIAIKQSSPPEYIMRDVNHYMTAMGGERTGTLNGFVEAALGHDSNVSSVNGSGTITNPSFNPLDASSDPFILLGRDTRQHSDAYRMLSAGLNYYQPLNENTGIQAGGYFSEHSNFTYDRYDTTIYRGSASLIRTRGKDQLRATLATQDYRLSDSDYQTYHSLSGDWTRYSYGNWNPSVAVFINQLSYDGDPLRDIYQYIVNAGLQKQENLWSQNVGMMFGDEDARHNNGSHNARTFSGLYYNVGYDLFSGHQLFARTYYQDSHQKAVDPFFHQVRDSSLLQLTLGWDWHINKPLRLRTEVIYTNSDSDIEYYGYERTRAQTALRYSF